MVEVEFIKDYASMSKGDRALYNGQLSARLIKRKIVKLVKAKK